MDLFEAAEDREPKICGTCGFICKAMTGPDPHYCDRSKKATTPTTPADDCSYYAKDARRP